MSVSFTAGIYGFELKFTYSATTTSPAGAGELRFNNASPGSATAIYIDAEDRNNVDVSAIVAALNTNSSLLVIDENDPAVWALFTLGSVTDNTTDLTLSVTAIEAIGSFSGNISLCVAPKGATGSTGSVSAATVLQRLVERGDRDRQRQTDQAQSIKATEYIGNGYVRQIGQAPTQSRYLGNAGLIPGELVAPIGRGQAPTQSRYLGNAGLVPGKLVAPLGRGQAPTRSRYLGNAGLVPGKLVTPLGRGQQYVIIHKKPVPFFTPETIEEETATPFFIRITGVVTQVNSTFDVGANYSFYDFNILVEITRESKAGQSLSTKLYSFDTLRSSIGWLEVKNPVDGYAASGETTPGGWPQYPPGNGSGSLSFSRFSAELSSSSSTENGGGSRFASGVKVQYSGDVGRFDIELSANGTTSFFPDSNHRSNAQFEFDLPPINLNRSVSEGSFSEVISETGLLARFGVFIRKCQTTAASIFNYRTDHSAQTSANYVISNPEIANRRRLVSSYQFYPFSQSDKRSSVWFNFLEGSDRYSTDEYRYSIGLLFVNGNHKETRIYARRKYFNYSVADVSVASLATYFAEEFYDEIEYSVGDIALNEAIDGLTFLKESSEIDAANFFPTSNFELTILSFLGL